MTHSAGMGCKGVIFRRRFPFEVIKMLTNLTCLRLYTNTRLYCSHCIHAKQPIGVLESAGKTETLYRRQMVMGTESMVQNATILPQDRCKNLHVSISSSVDRTSVNAAAAVSWNTTM